MGFFEGGNRDRSRPRILRSPLRPKPRFRLTGHEPKPWVRLVRSSRAETRSCPTPPEPKLLLSRWQRARPRTSLSAGLVLDREIRCPACPFRRSEDPWSGAGSGRARRPFRFRMGASRSLPPSHPLKGKPAIVRIAAASSAALPSASASRRSEDRARHPPGLWLGRLSSVAGGSSRPRFEAVTENESHQADSTCG